MSTHNIGFYEEAKLSLDYHQICTLSLLVVLKILQFCALAMQSCLCSIYLKSLLLRKLTIVLLKL